MNSIFTSSKTGEWSTPEWLFKQLDDEFHFQLDVACTVKNQKCKDGWGLDNTVFGFKSHYHINAINKQWHGWIDECRRPITQIWCNPPYHNLEKWINHGYEASLYGCTVVFLLPTTKTDQRWWHEIIIPNAAEIRFIEGRVKFGGAPNAAPFPSVVVIFKPDKDDWNVGSIRK